MIRNAKTDAELNREVSRLDKVIAGHGRLMACRELGWHEAPTLRLEHLTRSSARLYDCR